MSTDFMEKNAATAKIISEFCKADSTIHHRKHKTTYQIHTIHRHQTHTLRTDTLASGWWEVEVVGNRSVVLTQKVAEGKSKGKRFYTLGLVTKREREAKGDEYITAEEVLKLITVVDMRFATCGISGI